MRYHPGVRSQKKYSIFEIATCSHEIVAKRYRTFPRVQQLQLLIPTARTAREKPGTAVVHDLGYNKFARTTLTFLGIFVQRSSWKAPT